MEANTRPSTQSQALDRAHNDDSGQASNEPPPQGERFRAPARVLGATARIVRWRSAALLCGLSLVASSLMFPPVNWTWLGYCCLVPWLICVCTATSGRLVYFLSWLFGLGFIGINIRWMGHVTLPGFAALTFYCALFFPLAAWPIRHMHHRHGVSVALVAAIVWTAAEFLRSSGELAFPWLLLGHTQYKFLTLIQISDVAGAYGVSFILAMVNGWLTDLLIQPILIWRSDQITRLPLGTLSLAVVLIGALFYGWMQSGTDTMSPGPRVAVIQHDFPMYVDERTWRTDPEQIFRSYLVLAEQAAAEKPDLIVMPETAVTGYLNDEFISSTPAQLEEIRQRRFPQWPRASFLAMQTNSRNLRDRFQSMANSTRVPIVLGCLAMEWKPTAIPPRAEAYNSAFLLLPGRKTPAARYDKNHLVVFGEYVPFRYSYHWMYQWLNSLTPFGAEGIEYSLGFGSGFMPFEIETVEENAETPKRQNAEVTTGETPVPQRATTTTAEGGRASGRRYRMGTPICYEEIMPYIGREFARARGGDGRLGGKNVDILVAISNDGWFLHTAELEQHLAGAVFRAVENRIGMARSVNTGASAFIQPNGRITDRVELRPVQKAKLASVRAELEKLSGMIGRFSDDRMAPGELTEYLKDAGVLRARLAEMGKTFAFLEERLTRLALNTSIADPTERRKALAVVRDQVAMDLETVDRWRDRPGTAPGYAIAEVKCDSRLTLYTRWGDWFSEGAVALSGMMILDWLLRRLWRKWAARE